jgi:hypothetical protein
MRRAAQEPDAHLWDVTIRPPVPAMLSGLSR